MPHPFAWHSHCTALAQAVSKILLSASQRAPCLALCLLSACASIPKERFGIERLRFEGMRELSQDALRPCLVTEHRDKVTLGLGALASPNCGEPPFDKPRWSARLFSLPWTEWPVYDEAVLKLDLDRIERWYQARGFYGVRVLDTRIAPEAARVSDACHEKDCTVDITVRIEEGKPVHIRKLALTLSGDLPTELREDVKRAITLEKGDIFDEALYDVAREELARVLREAGYARAQVAGDVVINRGLLVADIELTVTPGPLCRFGEVRITSKGKIPEGPIRAATLLRAGQLYQESALEDAQRSIYSMGAFSAVTVRGELKESEGPEIPVVIELEPRRESQILVGAGIQAGNVSTGVAAEEGISVPQWDVHLLGSYENRNFFGGLRRFRIEERPRMLFTGPFPQVPDNSPHFGNTISANFSQPGVIDPRTSLVLEARWDNGPDPFLLFFRNEVGLAIGLERGFLKQRLNGRIALHQEIMQVAKRQPITDDVKRRLEEGWNKEAMGDPDAMPPVPAPTMPFEVYGRSAALYDEVKSYRLPFIEQRVSLDLRDDPINPRQGGYFRLSAHEAVRLWDPSWNYIRLTPDLRGYAPLPLGMVLAARFAIGWMHVFDSSPKLDDQARILGAQTYRLRGGGANSNRGFLPGDLGDGRTGGTHRWEASLELRIPLSKNFSIVGFGDMGDVNAGFDLVRTFDPATGEVMVMRVKHQQGFRFDHLNTAVGGGLRYRTVIGPIRLDVGYRPKSLAGKELDDERLRRQDIQERQFSKFRGAVHITIGESF